MRFSIFLSALLLATAPLHSPAQEPPPEVREKIAAATARVQVDRYRGHLEGSAFLIKKTASAGYFLAPWSLVQEAEKLTLTFRNTAGEEATVEPTVLRAIDGSRIAVLKVASANLPATIEVDAKAEVREGFTVFLIGCPATARPGDKPVAAITKGSILRLNNSVGQEPADLSLTGTFSPETAGAPVVDSSGRVLGIVSEAHRNGKGAKVELAGKIRRELSATVRSVTPRQIEASAKRVKLEILVEMSDPLEVVQSVGWAWFISPGGVKRREPTKDGKWDMAWPGSKVVRLRKDAEPCRHLGTAEFQRGADDLDQVKVEQQVQFTGADGKPVWHPPSSFDLYFKDGAVAKPPPKKPEPPRTDPPRPGRTLESPDALQEAARLNLGAAVADLFLARDRSALFALDLSAGRLLRLHPETLAVQGEADVGPDAVAMCPGPRGETVLVLSRRPDGFDPDGTPLFSAVVSGWNATSLAPGATFKIRGRPLDIAASDSGPVAISILGSGVWIVEANAPQNAQRSSHTISTWFVGAHPAGERFYGGTLWATPPDHPCLVIRPRENASSADRGWGARQINGKLGGDFLVTPDGAHLLSSAGGVLRIGPTRETDLMPAGETTAWISAAAWNDCASAFLGTADGAIHEVALSDFKERKVFKAGSVCLHLALDPVRRRLTAAVSRVPYPARRSADGPLRANLGCDLVSWSLEKK